MRARPTLATLRRLDKVESTLFDDTGAARGGVLLVPKVLGLDAWEALAIPTLQRLAQAAREDIDRHQPPAPYREALPDALTPLIEGVHFHRPDPYRNQSPTPLPAKRPPLPPKEMIR